MSSYYCKRLSFRHEEASQDMPSLRKQGRYIECWRTANDKQFFRSTWSFLFVGSLPMTVCFNVYLKQNDQQELLQRACCTHTGDRLGRLRFGKVKTASPVFQNSFTNMLPPLIVQWFIELYSQQPLPKSDIQKLTCSSDSPTSGFPRMVRGMRSAGFPKNRTEK